jgi:CubicO group peptidase (beta-lactamase class C family)
MQANLIGLWQGTTGPTENPFRVELELTEAQSFIHCREAGLVYLPVDLQVQDQHLELKSPLINLSVTLDDGTLVGQLESDWSKATPITLKRHHPDFIALETPRVDIDNQPITEYSYTQPALHQDGWQTASASSCNVSEQDLEDVVSSILTGNQGCIRALLVIRQGRLILDEYFHDASREKPHTIQSVTKSITSLILGRILTDYNIPLETPVHQFFADHADKKWVKDQYDITLFHALTMSAEIEWNEELPYTDLNNSNTAMNASPSWIGYVLDCERRGTPVLSAQYTSGLTILIGGIIKAITGRYVDEIATDGLFKDLGIQDFTWTRHRDGTRHTGGGLSIRARDLAKTGQLVLNNGIWKDRQAVPASWVANATTKQLPLKEAPDNDSVGYGYQWWLPAGFERQGKPVRCVAGLGYGGQLLGVFPSLDLVLVLNALEWVPGPRYDMIRLSNSILDAVQ